MRKFNKWLFLKNVKKCMINNIHLKNGMYVFHKKVN